jgi:hypothetical protein
MFDCHSDGELHSIIRKEWEISVGLEKGKNWQLWKRNNNRNDSKNDRRCSADTRYFSEDHRKLNCTPKYLIIKISNDWLEYKSWVEGECLLWSV